MSKILIAFFVGQSGDETRPNALPCYYETFMKTIDNGENVIKGYVHSSFGVENWGGRENMSASLIEEIEEFNPELCIFFNNAFYDLTEICSCPIFVYMADSPAYYSNKASIKEKPDRYYFNSSSDLKGTLINEFGVKENHIIDLCPITGIVREDIPIKANISFIGSKFLWNSNTIIEKFLGINPTRREIDEYRNCLNILKERPSISLEQMVDERIITSKNVLQHINLRHLLMLLSDEKRIHILHNISDLGLELYGTDNWKNMYYYNSSLEFSYHDEVVFTLKDNQDIYNSSKIGINISHIQAKAGFPWRIMDILASGACLVSDYHEDFEKYFNGLDFPIYKDEYEVREICKELLRDEDKRLHIVNDCNDYIREFFSPDNALKEIQELTGVQLL